MLLPKMGESIFECTVLSWLVKIGDVVNVDDMILEVATDKIDTEVSSTVSGKIIEFLVEVNGIAKIGEPICLIETSGLESVENIEIVDDLAAISGQLNFANTFISSPKVLTEDLSSNLSRFYSPLILSIAKQENISKTELDAIEGSGLEGRLTKQDILNYLEIPVSDRLQKPKVAPVLVSIDNKDVIIPMDRMRKMIAERMVESVRIAPHVTSFVETDMTNIVLWREKNKMAFKQKYNENITFTPILIEAIAKAILDFPMINIQVSGENIIKKGSINVGMAVGLPSGNLIVPVIKNVNMLNLSQLAAKVNELTLKAREGKLKPDDLNDGTYTISNIGTFGNIAGTPIIMQPQVAIAAFGAIQKKPAVIETPTGDVIAIRHKMIISHSYDHRVVDGLLGGSFIKKVSDYLEAFDLNRQF